MHNSQRRDCAHFMKKIVNYILKRDPCPEMVAEI